MKTERINFKVAGVTFEGRQDNLKKAFESGYKNTFRIVKEPDNPYDPNALKIILIASDGEELEAGYFPREIAEKVRTCSRGKVHKVAIYGGEDGRNYGCGIEMSFDLPDDVVFDVVPPTDKQLNFIASIEQRTGKKFTGKSKSEASEFISENTKGV